MHLIEPYYAWDKYYNSSKDELSPFNGKEYNYTSYAEHIYGYYIDPGWDFMGSETLYIKILFADYTEGFIVIEFIGEWNDAINNDVMHLKRNIIDHLTLQGINKYILIGENVLNFHGSDDCYYEEWFEDVDILRRNTQNGHPCGGEAFIAGLENRLDRSLRFRPLDRPRAEDGSNGERQYLIKGLRSHFQNYTVCYFYR